MTAALFVAGFPLAVAQPLLTALLLESLLGVSFSELLPAMPGPGAELPPPAEIVPRESASAVALLLFALTAAGPTFLTFAVLFSTLCLSFPRTTWDWKSA